MLGPRTIHCRVLGPARVSVDGRDAPSELLWRKHLALLVYLARSPRRARTRDHLIGMLWGDRDEKQARHSLSEALRVLRRALGEDQVEADVDQVRLGERALTLDCDAFAERRAAGDWAGAAALVEGEFLEGLALPGANAFEDWLTAERAAWRTQAVDALVRCGEEQLTAGDAVTAAATAQRALHLDAAAEPAGRTAMRALALGGDRAGALRVFERVERALREQLGATPVPETARLAERIREARVGHRLAAAPAGARPRPPLIGRQSELRATLAAWERARAGRGQVVLVEGEPGEGKTRLVLEVAARARLDDATVAWTRAVPQDRERPWGGVAGLLAGGLSDAPGLAGAAPGALAALGALAPDLAVRFPSVAAALPVADALRAAVVAAAGERAVLLALDDAQWLDAALLELLPGLARDLAGGAIMLVLAIARGMPDATRFDELRARIGRELDGVVVRLERFGAAELRTLAAWGLPGYKPEQLERLVRRLERDTAGIPLLAVAMIEAVAQGFRLADAAPAAPPAPPAWPSPRRTLLDSLPGDLPPAVIGAVCLQYRSLDEPAREVLDAASALEEPATGARLARATGLEPAAVEAALDRLEWARWLTADARGYAFTAPIARAILLQEMITPGQARRLRDRAGAA